MISWFGIPRADHELIEAQSWGKGVSNRTVAPNRNSKVFREKDAFAANVCMQGENGEVSA